MNSCAKISVHVLCSYEAEWGAMKHTRQNFGALLKSLREHVANRPKPMCIAIACRSTHA